MKIDLKTMSFREKILWVNLITMVFLFGYYFFSILNHNLNGEQATWLYLKVVFWTIVIEIVAISILSAIDRPNKDDERDKLYATRGYRWGYFVLFGGLLVSLWQTIASAVGTAVFNNPEMGEKGMEMVGKFGEYASPFVMINIMLGSMVLAEIAKSGAQLFYYRRGY